MENKAGAEEKPGSGEPLWHSVSAEEALDRTGSGREGLSEEEAAKRLKRDGPNSLKPPESQGVLIRFLQHFNNVLIYILIIAAVVTALLGHLLDSAVIMAVVIVNSVIGFIQEGKAEKALDAIRGMLSPEAVVLRGGKRKTIDAEEVVKGDIVLIQSGDRVSADIRFIEIKNLLIDESVLTGESAAVSKSQEPSVEDASLGDRSSVAFSGTLVTRGRGRGVVVATGEKTQIGKISEMVSGVEKIQTPLLRKIEGFSRTLSAVILAVSAATFAAGTVLFGYSAAEMFMAAVGIAVAAIPEGLPAIITITLSIGVQRMARRKAIIRRLPAVETLGSVTTICSDKTGTLTRNEMTVKEAVTAMNDYRISGVGYEPHGAFLLGEKEISPDGHKDISLLLRAGLLCNDAHLKQSDDGNWSIDGDPTEGCLIVAAVKAGFEQSFESETYPRTDVIPFESEHRFMATLNHDHEGGAAIYVKGAPERLLELCETQFKDGENEPLDRDFWEKKQEETAKKGQRLLALAYRTAESGKRELEFEDISGGLVMLGIVGIIDPPREEAVRAVAECRSAGIRVKMITGDYAPTARAIAGELGMETSSEPLTGKDIESLSDSEFINRALETDVFARSSPEHKIRLIRALRGEGQVVAMTGDGVNDAPALKQADIGVAMGVKGTEAAKEASEMVLADDNFATITHAVEEGRGVYDNIVKSILFILPTNGGQSLVVISALFLGLGGADTAAGFVMPVTPVQILWINMITTVTLALPLSFEPIEPGVMRRPPRAPDEPILSGFLIWRIAFVSVLMVSGAVTHFQWMLTRGAQLDIARSAAINTLVAGQLFYLFNSRFITRSSVNIRTLFGSRPVLTAVAALFILQWAFTYLGFMQRLFGTGPIDAWAWGRIAVFGLALFFIIEAEKAVFRKFNRGKSG